MRALILGLLLLLASCAPSSGILAGGAWESTGLQREHIRALVANAADPAQLYAGDARDGIFASSDSGQHWLSRNQGLSLPLAVNALSFDASERRLYAATSRGVFVSSDGGGHWQTVNQGLPADSCTALAIDVERASVLYVGTAHHGVFVSSDGGEHWHAASQGLPANLPINDLAYVSDRGQLWAATVGGVYRSDNGGQSWRSLSRGLPAGITVYRVRPAALSGGDPNLVFAGSDQGIFLSHDNGASWQRNQEGLARVSVRAILVDFRSPTTIYLGTSIGVLRSNDSGQVWSAVLGGDLPRNRQVYALTLGASDYSQLYAAVDDVYIFPGSSGGWNTNAFAPLLLAVAFFALLYWLTRSNRRHRRGLLGVARPTARPGDQPPTQREEQEPQLPSALLPRQQEGPPSPDQR
ncbi:WD40/YVTN/BNR-like repeat-containing protein [Thermogemmatispora tikiterensis]|uniref:WD40/YVTN/BNR-like repeat-containing protein n=1 Tax=Thermogemmatispora tikiterensis TaxID=1825093 RepID=UPI0011BF44BB|nr:hypothetical protein [Thermogemmatispora tikiterensis]